MAHVRDKPALSPVLGGQRLAENAGSDTPATGEITFVENLERVDGVKVSESVENP